MKTEWDESKRAETATARKLDFADFPRIFEGPHLVWRDSRKAYPEDRFCVMGYIDGRLHAGCYTWRSQALRVISFRKANPRENRKFKAQIEARIGI